ncbi:MAG: hypothetical protein ACRDG5_09400 [Anaerolineales bacterium]
MSAADLQGEVLGMTKTEDGDNGFDPAQPWYVRFQVTNKGGVPATEYSVKLETFNGPTLASGVFCWTSQKFPLTGPDAFWASDFHLPTGISQPDFGVKHMFVFTIDWKAEVSEDEASGGESNNFVIWAKRTSPPVLPKPSEPPPPPPSPWSITGASAVVGKKDVVVAAINNQSGRPTRAATLQLRLHVPKPGAPAGKPELAGTAKVPPMDPGGSQSVTIMGRRAFLVPQKDAKTARKGSSKAGQQTTTFTPLIPFSLTIKGAGAELGFGPPPVGAGPIKFPGKK